MKAKPDETKSNSDFQKAFNGKFYGVLRWQQLDDLWNIVKTDDQGWYIYALGEPLATTKKTGNSVNTFVDELNQLLRREHDEDYCGLVYTDSFEKPRLIKVFDPNNLGTSCSIATTGPLPSWVISKMQPEELSRESRQTGNRRRWWQTLFSNSA